MSDVFQRVAEFHRNRHAKNEKQLADKSTDTNRRAAYFKDSGVLDMWEDVKDIKVVNPAPAQVPGFIIPLSDLLKTTCEICAEKTGIVLFYAGGEAAWHVDNCNTYEKPELLYRYEMPNKDRCINVDKPDAKKKFVNSFVRFLARVITPQMLLDMDIDLSAPATEKKKTRKFIQVAET